MNDELFAQPSIAQRIYDSLDEQGYLPRDFSIRKLVYPPKIVGIEFADGFFEGNVTGPEKGEEPAPEVIAATEALLSGQMSQAVEQLEDFFTSDMENLMNDYTLTLQQWVDAHREEIHPEDLIWYAGHLLQEADNPEIVKYALTLTEFADLHDDEELAPLIRLLAQCNEFTLYCLRNFLVWETAQEEIFQTAQLVYGWGRVFALENLEPRTAQVRQWMLEEGWENDVNPEYTAKLIADAIDLVGVLEQASLSLKAFRGAVGLVEALLEDEPVPGISELRQPVQLLRELLRHAEEQKKDFHTYEVILKILRYATTKLEGKEQEEIKQACGKLLNTFDCAQAVKAALKQGKGFELARALELPYAEEATELILKDPVNNRRLLACALTGEAHHDGHVMELYEELIPGMKKIFDENRDHELSVKELFEGIYEDLNAILDQLIGFPGTGEKLFLLALDSPAFSNRRTALLTLQQWKKLGYALSPDLKVAVEKLLLKEKRKEIRKEAKKLLGI